MRRVFGWWLTGVNVSPDRRTQARGCSAAPRRGSALCLSQLLRAPLPGGRTPAGVHALVRCLRLSLGVNVGSHMPATSRALGLVLRAWRRWLHHQFELLDGILERCEYGRTGHVTMANRRKKSRRRDANGGYFREASRLRVLLLRPDCPVIGFSVLGTYDWCHDLASASLTRKASTEIAPE